MNIDIFIKGPLPFLSVTLYLRITSNFYCAQGVHTSKVDFQERWFSQIKIYTKM